MFGSGMRPSRSEDRQAYEPAGHTTLTPVLRPATSANALSTPSAARRVDAPGPSARLDRPLLSQQTYYGVYSSALATGSLPHPLGLQLASCPPPTLRT